MGKPRDHARGHGGGCLVRAEWNLGGGGSWCMLVGAGGCGCASGRETVRCWTTLCMHC